MKKYLKILATLCLGTLISTIPLETKAAEKEVKGAWISTVNNLDYPSIKNDQYAQKKEFTNILDRLQKVGINTVYVQVRPSGDSLYVSAINPWSSVLTGEQGKNPGYDPLQFMIQEAHARGLKLHAWLNPYRITSSGTDLTKLASNHPARLNPSMAISYNNALYYNPESETVKSHIVDTVKEIVKNYDVDGIHFDDYFYPNNYPLPEGETGDGVVANQRRGHINDMVKRVSQAIKSTNSKVEFGISPIGIWKNQSSDSTGSNTKGNESYYAVYADTRTWIKNGWIDYVIPQIYWETGHTHADYETLVKWWSNEVKGTNVKLYIGQGIYKEVVAKEIDTQLNINKKYSEVKGSSFFRAGQLLDNYQNCATKIQKFYLSNSGSSDVENIAQGKIITYDVILRDTPSYSGNNLATIKVGEIVEYLEEYGEFTKVKYNGKTGYVVARYVQKITTTTPPTTTPSTPTTTKTGTVNCTTLNVRSGAGTNYSVVTKLNKNAKVTILETKNGWHRIQTTDKKTGWVSASYINITTASAPSTPSTPSVPTTTKTGTVNCATLNVRSGAGTNYSVVTKLNKNAKVTILETKNGWHRIQTADKKTGWVSASYVTISTNTSTPSTPTTTKTGTVNCTTLNVRSGAGTNYSVVTKLNKNAKVTILETKNGWHRIQTADKKTGWVSASYINS